MAKSYYTGEGVIHHKGKGGKLVKIGNGDAFPADFPTETLESLTKKGKVSDAPLTPQRSVSGETSALSEKVAELTKTNGELVAVNEQAQERIDQIKEDLESLQGHHDQLKEQHASALKTIEELTKSIPAAPAGDKK